MINVASRIVPLVDLTCLKVDCTTQVIHQLCEAAHTTFGWVACVCIPSQFLQEARCLLQDAPVRLATVCNFPYGNERLEKTLAEIDVALLRGADEIDLVMPYQRYFLGERGEVIQYIERCRKACPEPISLKIILETAAFPSQDLMHTAAKDMIYAGADFIKTSTGHLLPGADLESVSTLLDAIQETLSPATEVGIKISGGIHTLEQALSYITLVEAKMGKSWVSPYTCRIGASKLLEQCHALS